MIIYTCITNKYCSLPEVMPDGAEYICFGDADEVGPWKVYPTVDCGDPVRTSRYHKINCPFDEDSIFVDGSKLKFLDDKFIEIAKEVLSRKKLFILQHPHKNNYLEECAEYIYRGWVSGEELIEYTKHLKSVGFDFINRFAPECTFLFRNNNKEFNSLWWDLYMKGGVRDQLSCSAALQLSGADFDYEYHRDFINKFSDASGEGIWWNTKQGDYKYSEPINPKSYIEKISSLTGLSMMRYRTLVVPAGDIFFGDIEIELSTGWWKSDWRGGRKC
jgi:hypothetical protein